MIALQHCANDDRIFYKEALSLKKYGYSVSYLLLTDLEGYIKDMSGNILNPNKESEIVLDGVKIIGIKPATDILNKLLKKIFIGKFQKDIVHLILNENADIYHAHEPISLRFAFKASNISNKKVIFDSHESWIGGTIKERIIKKKYLKRIKYLITVNSGVLEHLSKKANMEYSEVIYNCSLPSFSRFNEEPKRINRPIQLVHEGSLSFNRGLKNMLYSLLLLKQKIPDIKLKIIGGSPKEESAFISKFIFENNLQSNITITGWIAYEDVPKELKNCDIGLILYSQTRNNDYSTSNKLFNYIASGLAIVSVNLHETVKILLPLKNSIIVKKDNVEKITEAITYLIENPNLLLQKKIASQRAYQKYNWLIEEKKLLNFYKNVIKD